MLPNFKLNRGAKGILGGVNNHVEYCIAIESGAFGLTTEDIRQMYSHSHALFEI